MKSLLCTKSSEPDNFTPGNTYCFYNDGVIMSNKGDNYRHIVSGYNMPIIILDHLESYLKK